MGSGKGSLLLSVIFLTALFSSVIGFAPACDNGTYRRNKANELVLFLDGKGMAAGSFNKHILGDVLRALQPRYLSQLNKSISGNLKGPSILDVDPLLQYVDGNSNKSPPSWNDLEKLLRSQQSPYEKSFRDRIDKGLEHSPLANQRTFGSSEEVSVTFYKDSGSWCPYCQKVWIALEEKKIPYKVVKIDMNCYAGSSKPSEFLSVQPNGNLPCAVFHDGMENFVVDESDDILAVIDSLKLSPKGKNLLPLENSEEMEYMNFLCNNGRDSLERRLYSEWMWFLTGKRKPVEYKERYEAVLEEVDSVLAKSAGNFFMGKDISMADIKFIPFIERQAATLLYFKGFLVRSETKYPNIVKWLEEMEKRPSYCATKSDIYTHSRALPPQISAECTFSPDDSYIFMKNAIDAYCLPTSEDPGQDATLWREPGWPKANKSHKREAAERIIRNRANIVKFASRAAGKPGLPAAAAPLADPRAEANDVAQLAVDIFLRFTVNRLLQNGARDADVLSETAKALAEGGEETIFAVVSCLDYLRQRIGVPRDMSYPAAQELRAELLNTSCALLRESVTMAQEMVFQESQNDLKN